MSSIKKLKAKIKKYNLASIALMAGGGVFLLIGLVLAYLVFGAPLKEEIRYRLVTSRKTKVQIPKPIDSTYAIVVPRIGANVKVIPNVDPYTESEYQQALAKGVAHARGTVFPGQVGNTFLFAHSSRNWEVANQYNAVFYLLYKLKKGDDIYVTYNNQTFHYLVDELNYVDASAVEYLSPDSSKKTLTLMTCWPPGTTLRRLMVTAHIVE
jgi:sortase A